MPSTLYIKNMVCNRCIMAVKDIFNSLDIDIDNIQLGEVETETELNPAQLDTLANKLESLGFELLDDGRKTMIEKIKTIIIQEARDQSGDKQKLSDLLSKSLHKDYSYISRLFTGVEGITIEKYFINQKIEKVKELIVYDELNLSQIAFDLGYSSVAHLSSQFRKVTGMTPTEFRKTGNRRRIPLDKVK